MFSPKRRDKTNEDTIKLVTSTRVTVLTSAGVSTAPSPGNEFCNFFSSKVLLHGYQKGQEQQYVHMFLAE